MKETPCTNAQKAVDAIKKVIAFYRTNGERSKASRIQTLLDRAIVISGCGTNAEGQEAIDELKMFLRELLKEEVQP